MATYTVFFTNIPVFLKQLYWLLATLYNTNDLAIYPHLGTFLAASGRANNLAPPYYQSSTTQPSLLFLKGQEELIKKNKKMQPENLSQKVIVAMSHCRIADKV
jgi:hypothetical protein